MHHPFESQCNAHPNCPMKQLLRPYVNPKITKVPNFRIVVSLLPMPPRIFETLCFPSVIMPKLLTTSLVLPISVTARNLTKLPSYRRYTAKTSMLVDQEIPNAALEELKASRWSLSEEGDAIQKDFKFRNFKTAWRFMSQVATACETNNHHPEWTNVGLKFSFLERI